MKQSDYLEAKADGRYDTEHRSPGIDPEEQTSVSFQRLNLIKRKLSNVKTALLTRYCCLEA